MHGNRCVSHVPVAVGTEPAHFDLLLARSAVAEGVHLSNDWLILKLQELVSLSYQVQTENKFNIQSTTQFVELLE